MSPSLKLPVSHYLQRIGELSDIIERLYKELASTMQSNDVRQRLNKVGIDGLLKERRILTVLLGIVVSDFLVKSLDEVVHLEPLARVNAFPHFFLDFIRPSVLPGRLPQRETEEVPKK